MPHNKGTVVQDFLNTPFVFNHDPAIAVALSGGPDSMALLHLLSYHSDIRTIHALTVDHGLRKDSAKEAKAVAAWVKEWPGVEHHILKWTGAKPEAAIMEKARSARYDLMAKWCAKHKINQLWLGHNQTDQAETFLFRLAKGSGLDGLGGMKQQQGYKSTTLDLMRPLLGVAKKNLQDYCNAHDIPHVQDPTNVNAKYARSRLRQSLPVLEAEGLSEKRLAVTAQRLARAREALDFYTAKALENSVTLTKSRATIEIDVLESVPAEIRLRMIRFVLDRMGIDSYGPRLETLEDRVDQMFADLKNAKRFTLGGFLFSCSRRTKSFVIEREG